MQEVSGTYTSPFLDADESKVALQARKVSGVLRNWPQPGTSLMWQSARSKSNYLTTQAIKQYNTKRFQRYSIAYHLVSVSDQETVSTIHCQYNLTYQKCLTDNI